MNILLISTLAEDAPETQNVLRALAAVPGEHRLISTASMNIKPCIGCNACWLKTPGVCAVKDDYEEILKAYLQYDAVIYLCGTALGFVDHKMKNVVDRILPLATMYTCFADGQMRHVPRYNKKFRFGLLYQGDAEIAYMNWWLERVAVNMHGDSLGAYPAAQTTEVLSCIQ